MDKNALPFKVKIATPCHARWEDMGGNDQVRFCDHCRKNVFNLSAMSAAEAADLIQSKNGNLCARIYQRADGTVLTEDCPVGVARHWRRVKTVVAGSIAAIVLTLVNIAAFARNDATPSSQRPIKRATTAFDNAVYKVKGWFGLNPPPVPVMGKMRATIGFACLPPNTNTPVRPTVPTSAKK